MKMSFVSEELKLLEPENGVDRFISTSLKLHELVRGAAIKLKSKLDALGCGVVEIALYHGENQHGFDVLIDGKRAYWFGCWRNAAWPLVVATQEDDDAAGIALDFSALETAAPVGSWQIYRLPLSCLATEDPIMATVTLLYCIVRSGAPEPAS